MEEFLTRMVRSVVRASSRPKRRPIDRPVRSSAPPICEIATAFKLINPDTQVKQESFLMDFYTSTGTIAHEVFQKWAGRLGLLYGNWVCAFCKVKKTGKGPMVCPKCHREMKYEEIALTVTKGLEGHTDGLVPVPDGYIVIDLKFVGKTTMASIKEGKPLRTHYYQINLYGYGLQKQGYNIKGLAVIYLDRSNPNNFKVAYLPEIDEEAVARCKRVLNKVRFILAKKPEKVAELKYFCQSPEDAGYCRYKNICFGKGAHGYLKSLVGSRRK